MVVVEAPAVGMVVVVVVVGGAVVDGATVGRWSKSLRSSVRSFIGIKAVL